MQVLTHVATRLALLHERGWVHRDVKPPNVLRRFAQHSWTLIDFGCAARAGAPSLHLVVWLCRPRRCVVESLLHLLLLLITLCTALRLLLALVDTARL